MGGRNSEHEVSVVSALGVMAALEPACFEVIPILIARDGGWTWEGRPVALCPGASAGGLITLDDATWHPVDVVFPVLHGPNGVAVEEGSQAVQRYNDEIRQKKRVEVTHRFCR